MMLSNNQQKQPPPSAQGKQTNQGFVTKILDNFGFIDDTIFFPLSCVNGPSVKIGDKVFYECSYSENLPFNWNASMVQLVSRSNNAQPYDSRNSNSNMSQGGPQKLPPHHPPSSQYPLHHQQAPQKQQPSGNYTLPPNAYQSNAAGHGGPPPPPQQQQPLPPSTNQAPVQPNANYYSQQPPSNKPMPPYGNSQVYDNYPKQPSNNSGAAAPAVQPQQPTQHPSGPSGTAQPFPDYPNVQLAVAAAQQFSQYYTPQSGANAAGVPSSNNIPTGRNQSAGTAPSVRPPTAQTSGSNYAPLHYTSTPGSAFINPPQQYNPAQKPPPPQSQGPSHVRPNWDHRDERFDPRRGGPSPANSRGDDRNGPPNSGPQGRFGGAANDPRGPKGRNNDRGFGGPPLQDDRYAGPQSDHFVGRGNSNANRDEFGRDIRDRKDESRFMHDKDNRDLHRDGHRDRDRDNKGDRDRDRSKDRDYKKRSSKRSISPVNSVASSTGGGSSRPIPSSSLPSKRRFDPCNIPKFSISKSRFSANELKTRMTNSIHVPSDLKEVIFSEDLEIDLLDINKPIFYKITSLPHKTDSKDKDTKLTPSKADSKTTEEKANPSVEKQPETSEKDSKSSEEPKEEVENLKEDNISESEEGKKEQNNSEMEVETKVVVENVSNNATDDTEVSTSENESSQTETKENSDSKEVCKEVENDKQANECAQSTKSSEHSTSKHHKFNVKVLLISLPEMTEIYDRIFGSDFDGSSTNKNRVTHLNKLFSLLLTRNSNDGYALIGGKYNKDSDGYLSNGDPNLVNTAIRIVYEQTELNLSSCSKWKVFSTFVYNRDNNLDSSNNAGYEITKIFFPDISTAVDSFYKPYLSPFSKEKQQEKSKEISEPTESNLEQTQAESTEAMITEAQSNITISEESEQKSIDNTLIEQNKFTTDKSYLEKTLENLSEMKVADLKIELDKVGIKVESRLKKDQLAQRLRDVLEQSLQQLSESSLPKSESDSISTEAELSDSVKRKSPDDMDTSDQESSNKKSKNEEVTCENSETSQLSKNSEAELFKSDALSNPLNGLKVKGHHLNVATLHSTLNPHRFDQFELTVVAELLRDSLIRHFCRYIYSSLVHNAQQTTKSAAPEKNRVIPVNYVHLAFSYFDKGHCGSMPTDDLIAVLNSVGYFLSKKVLSSLVGSLPDSNVDRVNYREFQEPPMLLERKFHYPTISLKQQVPILEVDGDQNLLENTTGPLIVERNSNQYNIDELIKQSEIDHKTKVRLNEQLSISNNKIGQMSQVITELEARQKKMSAATGRQNDELCSVKRERDQLKSKYEQLRKSMEKTVSTFTDLLKQHNPPPPVPPVQPTTVNVGGLSEANNAETAKTE